MTQARVKIREQTTTVKGRKYTRFVVDYGRDNDGKRVRRTFNTLGAAQADVKTQAKLDQAIGRQARRLTDRQLKDAAEALEILAGAASLKMAARSFVKRNPSGGTHTVRDTIREYLEEAEADNLRPKSIQDLRNRLGRFEAAFGERSIPDITRNEVTRWLRGPHTRRKDGQPSSPLTRKHYLTVVGGLFNFAIEQDYITSNPLTKKSRRRRKQNGMEDEHMPEILTVAEVEAVMQAAQEYAPSMIPPLAIGFFAGVRTNELMQLDWRDIDLTAQRITITPRVAKKRSVRHIDISENLLAWLAPYAERSGQIAPDYKAWRYRFDKVRTESKIDRWPHNAMRHCFATFHLMKSNDQNYTALQLGHRNTDLLFNHYRALATPEESERFWNIRPNESEGIVNFPKAKAG